ncbi:MAG: aldo/keto reductase family oxidoreductase [Lachnospiraceae bacterium]|nr:aldo/keto reductase family oxidoreductase [Lachnospiraceae bacterium]
MAMNLGKSDMDASRIALGCMRMDSLSVQEAEKLVNVALEQGITLFDHADIYGDGRSEEIFGKVLSENKGMRERMRIQTKCGIRKGFYDFSRVYILSCVEDSLRRLQTDCIDLLLLHRPDALMEADEVAETFHQLERSGKVRQFGVSNFNSFQLELLQSACREKLLVNQMQFGLMHAGMVSSGIEANTLFDGGIQRDTAILDYCRLHGITVQAWSPLQYGFFEGNFVDNEKFPELNVVLERLAKQFNVTKAAIAIAWILRHPANIQVIAGTTNIEHLKELCKAVNIHLNRKEWYELYRAAGNILP